MREHIFVRGEGGFIFKMDLPVSEPIAERMAQGRIVRVNADGSEWVDAPPAAPVEPVKRRRKPSEDSSRGA